MSALAALADEEDFLSNVPHEMESDLGWLLDLPDDPFKDSRDIFALYNGTDFEEAHPTGGKTNYYREMVWSKWLIFCEKLAIDSETVFEDLSMDQDSAKNICFAFLHSYVVNSKVRRPCLGPEEWHMVQTVTCAVTVEDVWQALVQNANRKILRPKTKKGGQDSRSWELKFISRYGGGGVGPAYDVARATIYDINDVMPPNMLVITFGR
ncbi:hypothetical protein TRIATDRAFT_304766 [Trichoderma atroviride IMI 206040]|uniref:Uncharacterized protein n=1 Tax=Hypocrea atroviridis (strain ATCC 20476 / IMI 206040) TaxID=452589 RepID=G9NJ12_HYPAI|nr:uncharacterized protein TRIATDRAFT_304766 [Trichoderma atroviride IMI 206040]EHK48889.1 hypothetical protein TRIATDRAFT_304766 [Trichoderma atroviride IMI 206040]